MSLIREVEINAAFDKRDPNPNKNYGIHGVEMRFLLKGKKGIIQFLLFTNWMLPHVEKELDALPHTNHYCHPLPADVGYHSLVPMYEGQTSMEDCPYLNGKPCYYNGSGLQAQKVYDIMVTEGGEAMWKELERRYNQIFGVK